MSDVGEKLQREISSLKEMLRKCEEREITRLSEIAEQQRIAGEIKNERDFYRGILETIDMFVLAIDYKSAKPIYLNSFTRKLSGFGPDEIGDDWNSQDTMKTIAEEDREMFASAVHSVASTGNPASVELWNILKDGSKLRALYSVTLSTGPHSGHILFAGANITDLWYTREALELAKEKAENATHLKDKFVSLVAHDLSSPLSSVHFALKQLAEGRKGSLDEGQKSFLLKIIRSTGGLVDTINNLLSHNRLDSETMKIEATPVELRKIVNMVIERVHLMALAKGIQTENRIPVNVLVKADMYLLQEVIQNLLINAIKYSHPGGIITIYQPGKGGATITIRDHGIGIDPALLPSLFSHGIKTSTVGTEGEIGAGLGLPLCNDIMKAHGGTITAERAEGGGSLFHLSFPAFTTAVEHA